MWKQLVSLIGAGNPLVAVLNIVKVVVVLALSIGLGTAIYRVYDTYANARVNQVIVQQQANTIAQQTHRAEQVQEGKLAEDKLILKQDNEIKKINNNTVKVIRDTAAKVITIRDDPTKSAKQKSTEVAQVHITALWDQFCDVSGGADPSCKATSG